ncbi:EKC/KEOPS complex subunit [Schizosaccharomyces cryophilus OY26]|uniref:EKC/KEOPS complex subunit n=1 Tax=Schizosaccharomyces cryophilus (strain OY26 / ATCC MYA-4695 / CBS 11777 / NBRC 106824 / NRRL Y48691) TaxID=653667 RepID=S9W1K2_SCHCR|nr:EKC/KEOPS complex subunit [Schizosaccharomyces cryophilus OY26]EPY51870.1 EKC/KEOPS complex subunit [Schizosaccharomyces cryophilus OY26]
MPDLTLTYTNELDSQHSCFKEVPVEEDKQNFYGSLKHQVRALQEYSNVYFTEKMKFETKNDVPDEQPIML